MKILLIYPTTTTNGRPNKYRKAFLPPLNLAILDRLTYLANKKHQVKIINECVEDIDFNSDCDLVGITCLTSNVIRAYQIADTFRGFKKKVLLGGIHPSLMPHEAINHADSVVIGEAENIWPEILSDVESNRLKRFYQDRNFPDLEQLIIPKWNNMSLGIYRRSYGRKMPRMPIYTTRGCIHACKFCSVSKFFGRSYRCKPISHVLEEIKSTPAESYFFTDDNIICKPNYSENLFKALCTIDRKIRWFSQASTSLVNKPYLIDLAAQAGCRSLFFGVESINPHSLKALNKNINDPNKYIELSKACSRVGIQPWFSMIFGFDEDSLDTMIKTVEFLKKHNVWNVVFWILTPLPGTDLFNEMKSSGRIKILNWEKYDLNHVVFSPNFFESKDLAVHFWNTYKSMYTISSIYLRSIYALKISKIKGLITSLINQFYTRDQINKHIHPYSMGIWPKN